MKTKYTKETLIQSLKDFHTINGRSPVSKEFPNSTTYERYFGSWNKALTLAGLSAYKKETIKTEKPCQCCGKPTTNPKFCGHSCSAIIINSTHPKRQPIPRTCSKCNINLVYRPKRVCEECNTRFDNQTIGELRQFNYRSGHASLRARARTKYKDELTNGCERCGYTNYVEVCHITPVVEFPNSTPVKEVNRRENILLLCPNCHWELDHK